MDLSNDRYHRAFPECLILERAFNHRGWRPVRNRIDPPDPGPGHDIPGKFKPVSPWLVDHPGMGGLRSQRKMDPPGAWLQEFTELAPPILKHQFHALQWAIHDHFHIQVAAGDQSQIPAGHLWFASRVVRTMKEQPNILQRGWLDNVDPLPGHRIIIPTTSPQEKRSRYLLEPKIKAPAPCTCFISSFFRPVVGHFKQALPWKSSSIVDKPDLEVRSPGNLIGPSFQPHPMSPRPAGFSPGLNKTTSRKQCVRSLPAETADNQGNQDGTTKHGPEGSPGPQAGLHIQTRQLGLHVFHKCLLKGTDLLSVVFQKEGDGTGKPLAELGKPTLHVTGCQDRSERALECRTEESQTGCCHYQDQGQELEPANSMILKVDEVIQHRQYRGSSQAIAQRQRRGMDQDQAPGPDGKPVDR